MSLLDYWRDLSPFTPRTTIRSDPMNQKMGGISANLQAIVEKINSAIPKLPGNFSGNTQIPAKVHTNSLLYINGAGDMDVLPVPELVLSASHEVAITTNDSAAFTVNGDNHNQFIRCTYVMPPNPTDAQRKLLVTVGRAVRTVAGEPVLAPGSLIFFAANTDAELWLVPDTAQGVSILSSGTLRAYGKHSAIALISLSETQWLMVGDIYPAEVALG